MTEPKQRVVPLDADWPGHSLPVMPGDFSRYVPHGMGIGGPAVIRPWDDPLKVLSGPNFYGLEAQTSDPVRSAPIQYPRGGVIYFDENVPWARLAIVLSVIGVRFGERDYLVIAKQSQDPMQDHYLDQVRIGSRHGIGQMFEPGEKLGNLPKQPIPVEDYIQQFIAEQQEKWSWSNLHGTAGGDGDWAKERLAFGFMVENAYWQIYRMWSRPWLVTK